MKGEYHPKRAVKYSTASPWISLLLYVFAANCTLLFLGSFTGLTGSKKIPPRLFFGICSFGLPFFTLSGVAILCSTQKLYPRVTWDIGNFIFTGIVALAFQTASTWRHVRIHGNEAGTMPFEVQGDLGSTFNTANAAIFISTFFALVACARAIIGYSLQAYPLSDFKED